MISDEKHYRPDELAQLWGGLTKDNPNPIWQTRSLVYVQRFARGTDLFRATCERDMEGIVAKLLSAKYTPEATTWVKIKNREYSQAVGREDFFQRPKSGS